LAKRRRVGRRAFFDPSRVHFAYPGWVPLAASQASVVTRFLPPLVAKSGRTGASFANTGTQSGGDSAESVGIGALERRQQSEMRRR